MSVTIKDVAKAAGVTASTVSRVINNKGAISEETRNHVLRLMKEMNYFPNSTARSFVSGSTEAIALVVDVADVRAYSNNFFNNSVFGIETAAHTSGFNLIITNGRIRTDRSSAEKLVFGKKVDGIILPASLVKNDFIDKLNSINFPYVILGEPSQQKSYSSWVDINNIYGGESAAEHLLNEGYRKIAFLSSGEKELFNKNRITGYSRCLDGHGIAVNENYIRHCAPNVNDGMEATEQFLQWDNSPDAVICSDYNLAIGALRAAKKLGVRVPDEFGIISFDNSPVTELSEPPITTVDIDTFDLGEQAAKILIQAIKDKEIPRKQILISTRIIERESTNKPVIIEKSGKKL